MHCFFNHPVALPCTQQIKLTDGMTVLPLAPYFTLNLLVLFSIVCFSNTKTIIAEKSEKFENPVVDTMRPPQDWGEAGYLLT